MHIYGCKWKLNETKYCVFKTTIVIEPAVDFSLSKIRFIRIWQRFKKGSECASGTSGRRRPQFLDVRELPPSFVLPIQYIRDPYHSFRWDYYMWKCVCHLVCCWCMYPRFLLLISIDICLPLTYKSLQVWVSLTSWPDLTRPDLCLWMLTARNLFVLSQFTCTCFHTLGIGPCFYCANISRINIYTLPTSQKTYDVFDWSI